MREGVVEEELGVVDELGDAVDLELGRVHDDARVQARDGVVVARGRGIALRATAKRLRQLKTTLI